MKRRFVLSNSEGQVGKFFWPMGKQATLVSSPIGLSETQLQHC